MVKGSVLHLKGRAQIDAGVLRADELDLNVDTGEIEARGHIRIGGKAMKAEHVSGNLNTGKWHMWGADKSK